MGDNSANVRAWLAEGGRGVFVVHFYGVVEQVRDRRVCGLYHGSSVAGCVEIAMKMKSVYACGALTLGLAIGGLPALAQDFSNFQTIATGFSSPVSS